MNDGADLDAVAAGLRARIRDLRAALERLDSFAFAPRADGADGAGSADEPAGTPESVAREFVLRALRALADPVNHRLLSRMGTDGASIGELETAVSLPRLAVWERLSDLLQVGLAERSLEAGRAALTPAGAALVRLVDDLAAATAKAGA